MLSFERLKEFLRNHQFMIRRSFVHEATGECWIECVGLNRLDSFLIWIPAKYKFSTPDTFKLYNLPTDMTVLLHTSNIAETLYDQTSFQSSIPTDRKTNIVEHLTNSYRHSLNPKKEGKQLFQQSVMFRQLDRLRYTVQGTPYRVALMIPHTIGFLDMEQNRVVGMTCDSPLIRDGESPKMYIMIDFRFFYDKIEMIEEEASLLLTQLNKVFKNTRKTHLQSFQEFTQQIETFEKVFQTNYNRHQEYEQELLEFTRLLQETKETERALTQEYDLLKIQDTDTVHKSMQRTNRLKNVKKRLDHCLDIKKNVSDTILKIKTEMDKLGLTMDQILFDNILLFDQIHRNIKKLD